MPKINDLQQSTFGLLCAAVSLCRSNPRSFPGRQWSYFALASTRGAAGICSLAPRVRFSTPGARETDSLRGKCLVEFASTQSISRLLDRASVPDRACPHISNVVEKSAKASTLLKPPRARARAVGIVVGVKEPSRSTNAST